MRPPLLPRFVSAVWLVLLTACGSIVRSTQETSPPAHGSEMEGLSYWLPKGSILLDGTWDKDAQNCAIKVGTLIEADTSSSRWLLTRKINHLFEDTVVLEVDPATGLLKTVNGTSEDKTAQIVATALEAAAKAMTFAAGTPVLGAATTREIPPPCDCREIELPATFHFKIPIDELPRRQTDDPYCRCFKITGPVPAPAQGKPDDKPKAPVVEFKVEVRRMDAPRTQEGTQIGKLKDGNTIVDGIVVRAPAPYEIAVSQPKSTLYGEQTVFLPDPARIYYLPLDRTPFVKNETKIALVNGVVQNVTTTRPSIILGIVGVPKTILTALIPLK